MQKQCSLLPVSVGWPRGSILIRFLQVDCGTLLAGVKVGQIIQWDGDSDVMVDSHTCELFLGNGTGNKILQAAGIPVTGSMDAVRFGHSDEMFLDVDCNKHFALRVRLTFMVKPATSAFLGHGIVLSTSIKYKLVSVFKLSNVCLKWMLITSLDSGNQACSE